MKREVLRLRWVEKKYEDLQVLHHVNLCVYEGEICALMGRNGVGKTTLLRIFEGSLHPDEGEVYVCGTRVHLKNALSAKVLGVHAIIDEIELVPGFTLSENIYLDHLGRQRGLYSKRKADSIAFDLAEEMEISLDFSKRAAHLSHYQKMLIILMRCAANHVKALVMDEPFSLLLHHEKLHISRILRWLAQKHGVAILLTSHSISDITHVADTVCIMRRGKIAASMPNPQSKDVLEKKFIHLLSEKSSFHHKKKEAYASQEEPFFAVKQLVTKSGNPPVNFHVGKGEILGIGYLPRTMRGSIFPAIFGMTPMQGSIYLDGEPLVLSNQTQALNNAIGYVTADDNILDNMPLQQNLTLPTLAQIFPGKVTSHRVEDYVARHSLLFQDMKQADLSVRAVHLSKGTRKKISLMRWLSYPFQVLMLDDPTKGLDPVSRLTLFDCLRELAQKNTAILLETNNFSDLEELCDRVIFWRENDFLQLTGASITQEALIQLSL